MLRLLNKLSPNTDYNSLDNFVQMLSQFILKSNQFIVQQRDILETAQKQWKWRVSENIGRLNTDQECTVVALIFFIISSQLSRHFEFCTI